MPNRVEKQEVLAEGRCAMISPITCAREYFLPEQIAHLEPGVLDHRAVHFFASGHCASMALAIHKLTGWPLVSLSPSFGLRQAGYWSHAAVKSPLGLFDASGPFTATQWARWQHLEWDDFRQSELADLPDARKHLELVIPFAEALLDRYFGEGWPKQPIVL
jgi:predicted alpha/beta hydrolase